MKKRAFRPVVCDAKLEDRVVPQAGPWGLWGFNPVANTILLNRFLLQSSLGFNNVGFGNPFLFNRFGLINPGFGFTTAAGANVVNAISLDWNAPVTGAFAGVNGAGLSQGTARGGAIPLVSGLINNFFNAQGVGPAPAPAPAPAVADAQAVESIAAVVNVLGTRLPAGLAAATSVLPGGAVLFNQLIAPTGLYGALRAQLQQVQAAIAAIAPGTGAQALALGTYYTGGAVPGGGANLLTPLIAGPPFTFNTANLTAAANQNVQTAQNFVRVI